MSVSEELAQALAQAEAALKTAQEAVDMAEWASQAMYEASIQRARAYNAWYAAALAVEQAEDAH